MESNQQIFKQYQGELEDLTETEMPTTEPAPTGPQPKRGKRRVAAVAASKMFDVEGGEAMADTYSISLQSNDNRGFEAKDAIVTVTLERKVYDEANPTWFCLTMATYYSGIPNAGDMEHNYHDSIMSQDKTITWVCKGPFKYSYLCLIVDGMWKDQKTIEPYTIKIDASIPAKIETGRKDRVPRILSDVVASRCLTNQATRQAVVEHYDGLRWSYKVIDYGNPNLSLYGIIIIVAHCTTEILESLEFDNLQDFYILGEPEGTTTIPVKLLVNNQRILLKRKNMTNEPFSFKSQWKAGRTIKAMRGGAGGHGDAGMDYLTPEQWAIAKPPKVKQSKEQDGNNLMLPKEKGFKPKSNSPGKLGLKKGPAVPQRKANPKPTTPMRKPSPKPAPKGGFKKGA